MKTPPAQPVKLTPVMVAPKHALIRTLAASFLGFLAVSLIFASFVMVWLDRTLTNTDTYVATVAPLARDAGVQAFVVDKVSEGLLNSTQSQELSAAFVGPAAAAGLSPEQLQPAVQEAVKQRVLGVISTPEFSKLWVDANRSVQSQIVAQLGTDSKTLTLDFTPVITGVADQLKTGELSGLGSQLAIEPNVGKITLENASVQQARTYYDWFKKGTVLVIMLAVVSAVASVVISVNHVKTLRRVLVTVGVAALLLALTLHVPSMLRGGMLSGSGEATAIAIFEALFHGLKIASLILGVSCIVVAVATKVYEKVRLAHAAN